MVDFDKLFLGLFITTHSAYAVDLRCHAWEGYVTFWAQEGVRMYLATLCACAVDRAGDASNVTGKL